MNIAKKYKKKNKKIKKTSILYILETFIATSHLYKKHEGPQDYMETMALETKIYRMQCFLSNNVNKLPVVFSSSWLELFDALNLWTIHTFSIWASF